MILPKSLQEKKDRESYVSRLIDLTRTLCHEPEPTVENFTSIMHSVCIVLDEWASGGRDTRPYKEEVEWVYPLYKFTQSMRHLPPDKDRLCKEREYAIDGAEKNEIDEAMWDLYRDLEKIAFQFELRLTDARDPRVPLKRYGGEADCNQPLWWKPAYDSSAVDYRGGFTTTFRLRPGVVTFFTRDLDDILHAFELLAANSAPPESDIRRAHGKLMQELDMSKNGNVQTTQEDDMRHMADLPSKQKPAAAEPPVAKPCRQTESQVKEAVYASYKQYRDKLESQNEAITHAIRDNIVGITHYQLWRGKSGKGEPGTSVEGCKRTLRDNGYDLSYEPAE